jgi:hypothetical protein
MALIDKDSLKANIIKRLGISKEEYLLPAEKVICDVINDEPPVHTEPLTDYEQRIFLAAMEKERAVCKKLADEWDGMKLDVPCPVNLLQLCAEVERKVKAALWKS